MNDSTADTNPFLTYQPPGRRPMRAPMRARVVKSDADAPMVPTAAEKAERERSVQMRLYREHRREEIAMARGHQAFRELEKFLRSMTIEDGDKLVDHIKRSSLPRADLFTRYTTLRVVADAIERLRIQNGLPPYDDSLPGEDPTVFEIIRAELGVP